MTSTTDQQKWDEIYQKAKGGRPTAAAVLEQNTHLLPTTGKALDLACGRGGNALLLAHWGLDTTAWDISPVVLKNLEEDTAALKLQLTLENRDVSAQPPETSSFDVIVVSRFLDRELMPFLVQALHAGGLIFYQTFIKESVTDAGPRNLEYCLGANELLNFFGELQILVYREEGKVGDIDSGFRNEAKLVARKVC